jgi:hypothetical protein
VKADDKTVAKVRRELERRSEIPNVETITDTKRRQQPTRKTRRTLDPSSTLSAAALLRNPHKTYICRGVARKRSATSAIIRA